jgi:hypothetical protein
MPFFALGESPSPNAHEAVVPLRAVHSSFIVWSRAILRELGIFDAYVAQLSPVAREALETTPAGVWVPVTLARAHLEACETLGLSTLETLEMGRKLASRLHDPVLRVALRLAGVAGATPMFLAKKAVKLWPQRNDGGDLWIFHKAPREARIELHGYSLANLAYVRTVWRGMLEANAKLVMPEVRVTELTQQCRSATIVYAMTW